MVLKLLRVALIGLSTVSLVRAGEETRQKVGVTVVEVPVRVTDKHGKPVNDLQAANFAITDDGKPQDIVSLSLVGASALSDETTSGNGSEVLSSPPRTFILLFDQILTGQFSIVKAQQAASEFVRATLRPQDPVAVIALTVGVMRTLDTEVLFRQVFAVAVIAFAVLVFWNHEAWIASANINRSATTGKLDATYITRDLSPNAIPVVVSQLRTLPEPMRTEVHDALVARYGNGRRLPPGRWFEWNLRRRQARAALASLGLPLATGAPVVVHATN